jgi:hypothetical protein
MTEFEKKRLLVDALVYEAQQLWLHYRHVEQERNQFLGYFFTLLVAIVGFFVAIGSRAPTWPTLAMGLSAMAAVLGLICFLIFTSVRKFGAALNIYDREIDRIREALAALLDVERTHLTPEHRAFSMSVEPSTLQRVFDPQFAAEVIVGTSALAAIGLQVFVATAALVSGDFSAGQRAVACVLAAASVASVSTAVRLWIKFGGLHRR